MMIVLDMLVLVMALVIRFVRMIVSVQKIILVIVVLLVVKKKVVQQVVLLKEKKIMKCFQYF